MLENLYLLQWNDIEKKGLCFVTSLVRTILPLVPARNKRCNQQADYKTDQQANGYFFYKPSDNKPNDNGNRNGNVPSFHKLKILSYGLVQ
jgi:hypothetical protein